MGTPSSHFIIGGEGVVGEDDVAGESICSSSSHAVSQISLARNNLILRVTRESFQCLGLQNDEYWMRKWRVKTYPVNAESWIPPSNRGKCQCVGDDGGGNDGGSIATGNGIVEG